MQVAACNLDRYIPVSRRAPEFIAEVWRGTGVELPGAALFACRVPLRVLQRLAWRPRRFVFCALLCLPVFRDALVDGDLFGRLDRMRFKPARGAFGLLHTHYRRGLGLLADLLSGNEYKRHREAE